MSDTMIEATPEAGSPEVGAGYYRDYDAWLYVTGGGVVYLVSLPWEPEPLWQATDEVTEDCEAVTPGPDELELSGRARVGYGIPA